MPSTIDSCKCSNPDKLIRRTASESSYNRSPTRKSHRAPFKNRNDKENEFNETDSYIFKTKLDSCTPWQRLFYHQTKASMRKNEGRVNFSNIGDELDFVLSTAYEHNEALFPDKCEVYFQPTTLGKKKKTDQIKDPKPKDTLVDKIRKNAKPGEHLPKRVFPDHPLIIGGVKERIHPCSIKLMNSSHHSPQTNAGYVRQDRDGNLFQY